MPDRPEHTRSRHEGALIGAVDKNHDVQDQNVPMQSLMILDLLKNVRFANALESLAYGFLDRFGGAF